MHTRTHAGSQAYGAQKYHLVGNILQQSLVITAFALIPISVLWFFAGSIFHLSGIVPEIADSKLNLSRWISHVE